MFRSVRLTGEFVWKTFCDRHRRSLCFVHHQECFHCVFCSANAVSSRDGLDTETGTESLLSHRRERERERARRRARETEREYHQEGHVWTLQVQLSCLFFSSSFFFRIITFQFLSRNCHTDTHAQKWTNCRCEKGPRVCVVSDARPGKI